jgi:hypothetical protein
MFMLAMTAAARSGEAGSWWCFAGAFADGAKTSQAAWL